MNRATSTTRRTFGVMSPLTAIPTPNVRTSRNAETNAEKPDLSNDVTRPRSRMTVFGI